MLTDRERKMTTIIYNLFKAKSRHATVNDLAHYMRLSESDIKESLQQLKEKKQIVEVRPGCFVTSDFEHHYRHKSIFNK